MAQSGIGREEEPVARFVFVGTETNVRAWSEQVRVAEVQTN